MISVIIPSWNDGSYLEKLLCSLDKQSYNDFEVIVVDAFSKDNTTNVCKKHKVKLLQKKPQGNSNARNEGAKIAKGDILVFLDADTIVPKNYLERVAYNFAKKDIVAVAGPLCADSKKLKHRLMYFLTANLIPSVSAVFHFYQFQGPAICFKKSDFDAVSGFKEGLIMLEDNEIGNRIKKKGKVLWDRRLFVWNSPRSFEKNGYLKPTIAFLKGYVDIYIKKKQQTKHKFGYRTKDL